MGKQGIFYKFLKEEGDSLQVFPEKPVGGNENKVAEQPEKSFKDPSEIQAENSLVTYKNYLTESGDRDDPNGLKNYIYYLLDHLEETGNSPEENRRVFRFITEQEDLMAKHWYVFVYSPQPDFGEMDSVNVSQSIQKIRNRCLMDHYSTAKTDESKQLFFLNALAAIRQFEQRHYGRDIFLADALDYLFAGKWLPKSMLFESIQNFLYSQKDQFRDSILIDFLKRHGKSFPEKLAGSRHALFVQSIVGYPAYQWMIPLYFRTAPDSENIIYADNYFPPEDIIQYLQNVGKVSNSILVISVPNNRPKITVTDDFLMYESENLTREIYSKGMSAFCEVLFSKIRKENDISQDLIDFIISKRIIFGSSMMPSFPIAGKNRNFFEMLYYLLMDIKWNLKPNLQIPKDIERYCSSFWVSEVDFSAIPQKEYLENFRNKVNDLFKNKKQTNVWDYLAGILFQNFVRFEKKWPIIRKDFYDVLNKLDLYDDSYGYSPLKGNHDFLNLLCEKEIEMGGDWEESFAKKLVKDSKTEKNFFIHISNVVAGNNLTGKKNIIYVINNARLGDSYGVLHAYYTENQNFPLNIQNLLKSIKTVSYLIPIIQDFFRKESNYDEIKKSDKKELFDLTMKRIKEVDLVVYYEYLDKYSIPHEKLSEKDYVRFVRNALEYNKYRSLDMIDVKYIEDVSKNSDLSSEEKKILKQYYLIPRKKAEEYNRLYDGIFFHSTRNIENTLEDFGSKKESNHLEVCVSTIRSESIFRSPELSTNNVLLIGYGKIEFLFDFDAYTEIVKGVGKRSPSQSIESEMEDPQDYAKNLQKKWKQYANQLGRSEDFNEKYHMDEGIMDVGNAEILLAVVADKENFEDDTYSLKDLSTVIRTIKNSLPRVKIITYKQYEKLHTANKLMAYLHRIEQDIEYEKETEENKYRHYEKMYGESKDKPMSFFRFLVEQETFAGTEISEVQPEDEKPETKPNTPPLYDGGDATEYFKTVIDFFDLENWKKSEDPERMYRFMTFILSQKNLRNSPHINHKRPLVYAIYNHNKTLGKDPESVSKAILDFYRNMKPSETELSIFAELIKSFQILVHSNVEESIVSELIESLNIHSFFGQYYANYANMKISTAENILKGIGVIFPKSLISDDEETQKLLSFLKGSRISRRLVFENYFKDVHLYNLPEVTYADKYLPRDFIETQLTKSYNEHYFGEPSKLTLSDNFFINSGEDFKMDWVDLDSFGQILDNKMRLENGISDTLLNFFLKNKVYVPKYTSDNVFLMIYKNRMRKKWETGKENPQIEIPEELEKLINKKDKIIIDAILLPLEKIYDDVSNSIKEKKKDPESLLVYLENLLKLLRFQMANSSKTRKIWKLVRNDFYSSILESLGSGSVGETLLYYLTAIFSNVSALEIDEGEGDIDEKFAQKIIEWSNAVKTGGYHFSFSNLLNKFDIDKESQKNILYVANNVKSTEEDAHQCLINYFQKTNPNYDLNFEKFLSDMKYSSELVDLLVSVIPIKSIDPKIKEDFKEKALKRIKEINIYSYKEVLSILNIEEDEKIEEDEYPKYIKDAMYNGNYRMLDYLDFETVKKYYKSAPIDSEEIKTIEQYYIIPKEKAKRYNEVYEGIFFHSTANLDRTLKDFKNEITNLEVCVSTIRTESIFRSPSISIQNVLFIGYGKIEFLFDFDAYTNVTSGGKRLASKSVETGEENPIDFKTNIQKKWVDYAKSLGRDTHFSEKDHMDEGIMDVKSADILLAVIPDNEFIFKTLGDQNGKNFREERIETIKKYDPNIVIISNSKYQQIHSSNQLMNYLHKIKQNIEDKMEAEKDKYSHYEKMYEANQFKNFLMNEAKLDIDMDKAYDLFSAEYNQSTGTSWSRDKFMQRASNWDFYGDENGFVAVRPQKSGFVKLVGMAGSNKSKYLGFKEIIAAGIPLWGMVSKNIAEMAIKMGMRVPNWLERKVLQKAIDPSVFGNAKIIGYTNDGGIEFEYPDVGKAIKYFVGTPAYYQKAGSMFKDAGIKKLGL